MGYYTRYELKVESAESEDVADLRTMEVAHGIRVSALLDGSADTMKWYDHEDDLRSLSRKFPAVLFTLRGEGEEAGDVWKKYFRDGKCQVAKAELLIAEFDERKLR